MAATPTPRAQGNDTHLVRVLRDMNNILTAAEDWEERVGCVLSELNDLLPMDLAAMLLAGSEHRFLVYLDSPLEPGLVESVKANVTGHYRLLTEQPVQAEAFPTSFLGLHTPRAPVSDRSNGHGSFGRRSYLSLPLLGVDEIVGVIHLFSLKPGAYDEEELNLFSLVAAKLGSYLAHVSRHRLMAEYDRERDGFMAEVIHELKNPLTSATGFTQLLMRQLTTSGTPNREKEVNMLERVHQQLRRVVQMADSMLDASRVRAGWMDLKRERVDLGALAPRVVEAVQATTDKHTLTMEIDGDCAVLGDEQRLEQVLRNLLSNAVKFSPAGGIVDVRAVRNDATGNVTVTVRDRGMGMPQAQQGHLFERYYRADSATKSRIGGSGLGLYISSEIVRRHGGRIEVQSAPDQGSTFSFALPLAQADA